MPAQMKQPGAGAASSSGPAVDLMVPSASRDRSGAVCMADKLTTRRALAEKGDGASVKHREAARSALPC